jgi:hypothetical protein
MRTAKSAAAAATMLGLATVFGTVATPPAVAALNPDVLAAVQSDEVALVALDIAALLEGAAADADEQEIGASLHRYLADTVYAPGVIKDALSVVMLGEWTEIQYAALKGIFSDYAVPDVKPPSGGGDAAAMTSGGSVKPTGLDGGAVASLSAPSGGASQSLSPTSHTAPPPAGTNGEGPDYRP